MLGEFPAVTCLKRAALTRHRRGTGEDFKKLVELGVELKDKIALIRYGGIFRGLKVKNAQDNGMIGAVIFTDPADDGNLTVAKGVEAYPRMSTHHIVSRRLANDDVAQMVRPDTLTPCRRAPSCFSRLTPAIRPHRDTPRMRA